ncbi:MAG TPA: nuclear transport factor 2 family protein [Ferruginibacter sp.]|nr:nuclear transport factor 2 family protein [Ferruginibacter sp.]
MKRNEELIENFYSAFQKLDAAAMNSNYADDIVFFDPVFGLLQGDEARSMWEMLCKTATDFSLTYSNIVHLDEEYSTCDWVATYTFSRTGKRVVNNSKAYMKFYNGKIIEHSDGFSLYKWCKQALGLPGILFGWNSFFQNRIRKQAQDNLRKFILNNNK